MTTPSKNLYKLLEGDKTNEQAIMKCIDDDPLSCAYRKDEMYPVALAIEKSLSITVIKKMLDCYQECCQVKNSMENLLLHDIIYASNKLDISSEAILAVIDTYPNAARISNKSCDLPLHIECRHNCRYDVIVKLLNVYPEAAGQPNLGNRLPLHMMLYNDSAPSHMVINLIDQHPDALRVMSSEGQLPIHMECVRQCRYDVIIKMLEIYPDAVHIPGRSNQLCLHFALNAEHSSSDVIHYLIGKYTDAVHMKTVYGSLPLHIECSNLCRYEIISKLLNIYPEAASVRLGKSCLLHIVAANQYVTLDLLRCIIDYYPAAITHSDKHGLLPFHHLIDGFAKFRISDPTLCKRYCYRDMIRYMLPLNSQAILQSDDSLVIDNPVIVDDVSLYRMMLHISSTTLSPYPSHIRRYHDINYQHRSSLLHLLLQLSSSYNYHHHHQSRITINHHADAMKYRLLLHMMQLAGRRVSSDMDMDHQHAMNEENHVCYDLLLGDDLGKHLLRCIIGYL